MPKSENQWKIIFEWFHRHPEVGYQEVQTTEKIRSILLEEGIEILPTGLKTGLIGIIRGGLPGKSICLRADIDGLPIEEKTGLPYRSENPGNMHACGHDFHITTALYIGSLLQQQKQKLHGNIYLAFQPAEEVIGGADELLSTGLLDEVEEFYGFHGEPSLEAGQVSIESGSVMGAVDQFAVVVTGKGCHGAAPHLGKNPILPLVSIVNQIQAFGAEKTNPLNPKVISITHVAGGETWNVIPDSAFLEGTVRSMNPADREVIEKTIRRIVKTQGEMAEVQTQVSWHHGPAAVINDKDLSQAARTICAAGKLELVSLLPAMLGDDFSRYTEKIKKAKGLYIKVGTGFGPPLHSPLFTVDPAAIRPAAEFYAKFLGTRLSVDVHSW